MGRGRSPAGGAWAWGAPGRPPAGERDRLDTTEGAGGAAAADGCEDRRPVARETLRVEVADEAGEVIGGARGDIDGVELAVVHGRIRREQAGAVRRPRRRVDAGACVRQLVDVSARTVHQPDVAPALEGDPGRSPERRAAVTVLGEAVDGARLGGHGVDVLSAAGAVGEGKLGAFGGEGEITAGRRHREADRRW